MNDSPAKDFTLHLFNYLKHKALYKVPVLIGLLLLTQHLASQGYNSTEHCHITLSLNDIIV